MEEKKQYFVYMMTNTTGMLYTGVTNDIERRVEEHKQKRIKGFTSRYNMTKLVYVESTDNVMDAIDREKQLKGWLRKKKVELINTLNPTWRDLIEDWNDTTIY